MPFEFGHDFDHLFAHQVNANAIRQAFKPPSNASSSQVSVPSEETLTLYSGNSEIESGDDEKIRLAFSQELQRQHEKEQQASGVHADTAKAASDADASGDESMDEYEYEEAYDPSYKDDRIKASALVGLTKTRARVNYGDDVVPDNDLF